MALLLLSAAYYLELQRSMRWWFERRTAHLVAQSDQIHNGVMQELFVLRRDLEAALAPEQPAPPTASYTHPTEQTHQTNQAKLQALEKIHQQLEQISNALSSPYIRDSLPLAMQFYLQAWQQIHGMSITLRFPTAWKQEATTQNQTILHGLSELLQIVIPGKTAHLSCCVSLGLQEPKSSQSKFQKRGELAVEVTYPNGTPIANILRQRELRYLRRVMGGLVGGKLSYRRQDQTVTWYFHWPLRSASSLTVRVD